MPIDFSPYLISFLVSIICSLIILHRTTKGSTLWFGILLLCQILYIFGYLFEMILPNLEQKIFWDSFQWGPTLGVICFSLIFVAELLHPQGLHPWVKKSLYCAPPVLFVISLIPDLRWTLGNNYHIVPAWPSPALTYDFGFLGWAVLFFTYVVTLPALYWLIRAIFHQRGPRRRQTLAILIGMMIPFMGAITVPLGITFAGYRDETPFYVLVGNLLILWGLMHYKGIDLIPLARERVFEEISEAFLILGRDHRIVDMNAEMERLLNVPARFKSHWSALYQLWPELAQLSPQCSQIEIVKKTISEEDWYEVTTHKLAEDGSILFFRNITQQKISQATIEEARNVAELANQTKSRFLANMSHEIRTPMNAVIGISHILSINLGDSKESEHIKQLEHSAQHLLSILNEILDFSKIEAGQMIVNENPFVFKDLLEQLNAICHNQAQSKNIAFEMEIDPNIPPLLLGDCMRWRQILINLCSNAIKFTEKGWVKLIAMSTAKEIIFEIQDTGIGISPDKFDQVFKSFNQLENSTTRRFGGTGLGLSICKSLVEMMGGQIQFESQVGQGSLFRVILDLKIATEQQIQHFNLNPNQSLHVLLVEDHPVNQLVAKEIMEEFGHRVSIANDGLEAIAMIKAQDPLDYSIVLMDLQMPNMDGVQATKAIRDLYPDAKLPILGLTADVQIDALNKMIQAGANDCLIKPLDPRELQHKFAFWCRT